MPCIPIRGPSGSAIGIACTGRTRSKPCKAVNCRQPSQKLCDWKLHKVVDGRRVFTGKTCDMPPCAKHAHAVGKDKDLCPAHYELAREQGLVR